MWFNGMGNITALQHEQDAIESLETAIRYIQTDFPDDYNKEKINNLKHALALIQGKEIIEFPMVIKKEN